MFTETAGSRKAIGDVDVLWHDGLYHLFHLVLPNHDFIAHAVSTDGICWRRVRNALFIGDPGSWDDLMLWTMHVSADPDRPGRWRMFYTGLSRRDRGRHQRIGLAVSEDLYHWEKHPVHWCDTRGPQDPEPIQEARRRSRRREAGDTTALIDASSCFPLSPGSEHYESGLDEGRRLVSFRDPYFFDGKGGRSLLASARVATGPVVRRGCVARLEEIEPGRFESRPPLHWPMLYDDVEVPNLVELDDHLFLIGSIREDAKIRYWHAEGLDGPWCSYYDNVLMPQGNYAGRICRDEEGWLLWCFFSMDREDRTSDNLMPPPKRLVRTHEGLLRLKSFEGFEAFLEGELDTRCVRPLKPGDEGARCRSEKRRWDIGCDHGFQAFVFEESLESFRLDALLCMEGRGKCGLVFRLDPDTHDGYYLSLDLLKGLAQLRSWGTNEDQDGEWMMSFKTLQSASWLGEKPGEARVSLLTFGSYLELSVDGFIVLSLADQRFRAGQVGVYLESARLSVEDLVLRRLRNPEQQDDQLVGA
jgi:beta-fructofuranosidase